MASDVTPQSAADSSKRSTPVDASKKSSTTQEVEGERRERSFQECIEFLMPVYLLPFVFWDKSGTCIYCVLLTVVGLMGRLLPSPVAAMLPIVILPLGGVSGVDQLAAHYLGPRVLSASLLFALAIIGDETTIFMRLCLYVLERYALRMEPLFVGMHWIVFGLSLILPSTLIVVFSTAFIDRFVATVYHEIMETDTRSGLRNRTSLSYSSGGRRTRWRRKSSPFGLRSRSVSVVSETGTVASEASGFSSLVREYKMHPAVPEMEPLDSVLAEPKAEGRSRKTSFGVHQRLPLDEDRPYYLPVRRIRSLVSESKQPSSILKRNPDPAQPLPSPSADVTENEDRGGTFSIGELPTASAEGSMMTKEGHNVHGKTPFSTVPAAQASSVPSKPPAATSPPSTSITTSERNQSRATDPVLVAASTLQGPNLPSAAAAGAPSPPVKCTTGRTRSPSPSKHRAKAKSKRNRAAKADASAKNHGDKEAHHKHPAKSATGAPHHKQLVELPSDSKAEAERRAPSEPAPKQSAVPDPTPEAKFDPVPAPKHAQQQQPKAEVKPEARAQQEPEHRQEIRGVLKKPNPSTQPITGSVASSSKPMDMPMELMENGVWNLDSRVAGRGELARASSELNLTEQRKLLTRQASLASEHQAGPASPWLTGAEQHTPSFRVRALTAAARSAFIAGAAYTAIFGNIAFLSTLPMRNTVLIALGCHDDVCPVNWWSWLAVSLPVAIVCCVVCWTSIYCSSIVSREDDVDERTQEDMSKTAHICRENMDRRTVREAMVFCILMGISFASSAYNVQHPEWDLEVPLLGLTVLVLSAAPGSVLRRCWSHRALSWRSLCSRMPWSIILMLGCVMALSRTVEAYRLVESGMARLGDQFWAQRSARSSQFILLSMAAILSELVVGESLTRSMATTVLRVAVVTETPVSFYVVPVSLAASINLVLPVSLPLLVMRVHAKSGQMMVYGVFLKCVAVTAIFISMNTIGLIVFRGDSVPKAQALDAFQNTTGIDSGVLWYCSGVTCAAHSSIFNYAAHFAFLAYCFHVEGVLHI